MNYIFIIIVILILIEIFLFLWINKIKVSKWILTDEDLLSDFRIDKFLKFKKSNFNELLGWDKKKNTKNFDRIGNKKISYSIDKKGFRKSKYKNFKNSIITFGDSYVFCRQVTDKDTWQEFISKKNKLFVSNYGVGNYGLDQSYLKFKKTKLNSKTKIILFGFVPETICRIQSIWKNFLEFGNVHGFKPYCLFQKKIYLKNNILKKNTKYNQLKKIVELAKQKDRFFIEKYNKRIFKFPYLISFLKCFELNVKILKNTLFRHPDDLEKIIFPIIMDDNISNSHRLYSEVHSQKVLENLMKKINSEIKSKKDKKIYFVVLPQLFDLKKKSRSNYINFFKSLDKKLNILDLTNDFLKVEYKKYFINDKYGGHLNKRGNQLVSRIIEKKIIYENNLTK